MLLPLKNLLTPQELHTAQALLGEDAAWIDGRSSERYTPATWRMCP